MAEPNTFIKLHRSILDSVVFSDAEVLRLWIYFLCNASVENRETIASGTVVKLKRGQLITGRKKLSQALGITESKIYRTMKMLEDEQCITTETNNRFTIITLVNWAKFQDTPKSLNNRRTANRTTHEQQANNRRTTGEHYIKNVKNIENVKNECVEPTAPAHTHTSETPLRGSYKNILLSDEEFEALKHRFPNDWGARIDRLSKYMADSKKTYASHYDTILKWAEQDSEKKRDEGYTRSHDVFDENEAFAAALERSRQLMEQMGNRGGRLEDVE